MVNETRGTVVGGRDNPGSTVEARQVVKVGLCQQRGR